MERQPVARALPACLVEPTAKVGNVGAGLAETLEVGCLEQPLAGLVHEPLV